MKTPPMSNSLNSDATSTYENKRQSMAESLYNNINMNGNAPVTGPFANMVVPGNSYDDYFHEAQERFHYALLAKNFWQAPYPPTKTKRDLEREEEDRKGRPSRPKSMMADSRKSVVMPDDHSADQASISSASVSAKPEAYEGLFLSRIYDQFYKMLELPIEQNLLVTSILQKITGVVDKRMDGVICDWRAVRVGNDGSLYGGVWNLPSSKGSRRSLYALLEQVTFEALKRAQLVPNFETRISLAKKRGIVSNPAQPQMATSQSERHQRREGYGNMHINTSMSSSTISNNRGNNGDRHPPGLSKLVFNKGSSSAMMQGAPRSPSSPSATKSAGALSLRITRDMGIGGGSGSPSSPSAIFFQNSPRANATPITMTNPFAKLSNFVNSYIVLQEFCKELAAVILVRHATSYNEIGFVRYQEQREMMMVDPGQNVFTSLGNNTSTQEWLLDEAEDDEDDVMYKQRNFDKWKNRISVVSTLADWRSVRSLDTIDEAITARVPSRTTNSTERSTS
jgi:hypothetical protein